MSKTYNQDNEYLVTYITRMARREIQKTDKLSLHELVYRVNHRDRTKKHSKIDKSDTIKSVIRQNIGLIAISGIVFTSNEFTNTRYEE